MIVTQGAISTKRSERKGGRDNYQNMGIDVWRVPGISYVDTGDKVLPIILTFQGDASLHIFQYIQTLSLKYESPSMLFI